MSSATVAPSEAATAQPSFSVRSTSTSSGPRSCPATRKPPVRRAPRTRRRRGRHAACRARRPRRGPSTGRFGRTRSSVASTGPSTTSLTRSSSAISSRWGAARSRPSATSRRSGCRVRSRRRGAGLAAQLDETSDRGDVLEQLVVRGGHRGPAGEEHRPRGVGNDVGDEDLPEVLGEERHDRRDDAQRVDERGPERAEGGVVAVPEAPPRAPHVPVREVVDEGLEGPQGVDGQVLLVGLGDLGDHPPGAGEEPAVERGEVARTDRRRGRRGRA